MAAATCEARASVGNGINFRAMAPERRRREWKAWFRYADKVFDKMPH